MPRGNGTGPEGMGPQTGRAMGYCAGFDRPGAFMTGGRGNGPGRGYRGMGPVGFQRGWGRGFGRGMNPVWGMTQTTQEPLAPETRRTILASQVTALKDQLQALTAEIQALDKTDDTEQK